MKEATTFFEQFKNGTINDINTILPGVIERFDASKMMADVKLSNGALVMSVPVMTIRSGEFFVRIPYKKGDAVLIGFAQQDIDNFIYGGNATPSESKFRLDDAFVLGGLTLNAKPLPSADADKFIISTIDGSNKIMLQNGRIDLVGQVYINGRSIG